MYHQCRIKNCFDFIFRPKNMAHAKVFQCNRARLAWRSSPVWPDWAILEKPWQLFLTKVAQTCHNFWGLFQRTSIFFKKTAVASFWKKLGYFLLSIICSHWESSSREIVLATSFFCEIWPLSTSKQTNRVILNGVNDIQLWPIKWKNYDALASHYRQFSILYDASSKQ